MPLMGGYRLVGGNTLTGPERQGWRVCQPENVLSAFIKLLKRMRNGTTKTEHLDLKERGGLNQMGKREMVQM